MTSPQHDGYQAAGNPGRWQQPRKVSGGTAITGGILAILCGFFFGYGGLGELFPDSVLAAISQFAVMVILIAGAITLLRRRSGGRWIICAGVVIAMVYVHRYWIAAVLTGGQVEGYYAFTVILLSSPFLIVSLLLVLLPSTKRWCAQRKVVAGPGYPPQHWGPQYQGQQQQGPVGWGPGHPQQQGQGGWGPAHVQHPQQQGQGGWGPAHVQHPQQRWR